MGTRVSSIVAELGIDSSKFNSGANSIGGMLDNVKNKFLGLNPVVAAAASGMAVLVQELVKAEQAAAKSAQVDAKLQAVLDSTGNVVGMTASRLDGLATSISKASGMDDELVKSAEAVLLTFTQISGQVFPEVMRAASDMSAVFGTDMQGAVIQVGKAMNDFSGYSALKRSGVSFTQEQISQIKNFKDTNDLIGYQNLILQELQTEFGGAAKAINEAGDGSENLAVATDNLKENIGKALIPATRAWNEFLTNTAEVLSSNINETNEYNESLANLGVTWINGIGYVQDGTRVSYEHVQSLVNADRATQAWGDRLTAQGAALGFAADRTEEATEEIEDFTKANQNMINMTASYESVERGYMETSEELEIKRNDLLDERALKLRQGYSEAGRTIKGIDEKLAENADAAAANADAHELASSRIILGYLEQQLAMDGLSAEETAFLLEKGVEWGVYSQQAVDAMSAALIEAEKLKGMINGLPPSKTVNVFVNTITTTTSANAPTRIDKRIEKQLLGGYANGADFIVPPGFPNDSFPMRVQSGEHVKVTPAGEASSSPSVTFNAPVTFQVANNQTLATLMREMAVNQ